MPASQPYNGISAAQRATMYQALVGALDANDAAAADMLADAIGHADAALDNDRTQAEAAADYAARSYDNASDALLHPAVNRSAHIERRECRKAYALYRTLHDVS